MAARMPLHSCSARCRARCRFKTSRFGSAPCHLLVKGQVLTAPSSTVSARARSSRAVLRRRHMPAANAQAQHSTAPLLPTKSHRSQKQWISLRCSVRRRLYARLHNHPQGAGLNHRLYDASRDRHINARQMGGLARHGYCTPAQVRAGASSLLPSGTRQGHAPAVVAVGPANDGRNGKLGRAKREGSARQASSHPHCHRRPILVNFARRITLHSSLGVKSCTNLTPDWIWVNLQLTIEAEGPRVLEA
jgi:hypothetical protein